MSNYIIDARKRPGSLLEDEYQVIWESVEFWEWLVDNFPAGKKEHPEFKTKYIHYRNLCPCCDYYSDCYFCPLSSCKGATPHSKWWDYVSSPVAISSKEDALNGAMQILSTFKTKLKELQE